MDALDLRRAESRGRLRSTWLDARFSFSFGDYRHPARHRFSVLRALNEDIVQPGTGFAMHPHHDMEILMLPLAGAIAHGDSLGHEAVVHPGEVLLMSAGAGIRHRQMNASAQASDHHLQLWLLPRRRGGRPHVALRRFEPAGRAGRWQVIASPDGRQGSLRIDQDACVMRAMLAEGSSLEFAPEGAGRSVYLHLATGEVTLRRPARAGAAVPLGAGDAVAWREGERIELRAAPQGRPSELLLFELPPHAD
ncbi:pirin family protein [Piscinibacter sp. XHJ-5]|uniref:pirin family protein n=1 Tax=Piscinibacter sp. XHJ-5 TaxID=3037797 RepID=UPI002452EF44|nr:pirin family protein [Piscinibacter sp. XHJ-5]